MPCEVPEVDHLQKDGNLKGKLIAGQVCTIKLLVGLALAFQFCFPIFYLWMCIAVHLRECRKKTAIYSGSVLTM